MSVGVNTWGYAQKNILAYISSLRLCVYRKKLVFVVNHERADAHIHSIGYVAVGLVVAVKIYSVGRKSRRLCRVKLAARHAVNAKPFLCGNFVNFSKAERF